MCRESPIRGFGCCGRPAYDRRMRPDQLETLVTVSAPTLSPDGATAVVAASRPSFAADGYVGQLWSFDTTGTAPPRRLTRGQADTAPQISPDGALLAFLRRVDGTSQLAIVEAGGGEPRVLTDAPLGVNGFAWSPDSARIAFTASMPERDRYGTTPGVSAGQESPRRVTGNKWRFNGRGYVDCKPVGIYVLDVPRDDAPWIEPVGRAARSADESTTASQSAQPAERAASPATLGGAKGLPEARLVTPSDSDAIEPVFAPDGEWVYFTASLHDGADDDLLSSIYRVPVGGGADPEPVSPVDSTWRVGSPTPAGDQLMCWGQDYGESRRDFVAKCTAVMSVQADGELRPLTDPESEEFASTNGFLAPGQGESVLAVRRERGADTLIRLTWAGDREEVVSHTDAVITGAAERGGTTVLTYTDPATPGELAVVRDGRLVTLSAFAAELPTPVAQHELTVTGPDGYPIHGWVFLPDGDGPHPVLLNIHGGPFADYSWGYFDEPQVLTAAGYAVVQCNPRGSQGYGRAHGVAIKQRMGTVDMVDVLGFLDGAIEAHDTLDGTRVGILGGSYGGYLTAWTIAHEHRFAAAIIERGYLDPAAFVGVSDIGWFFSDEYVGTDPEQVAAQSPHAVVGQVRTPALILHSEEDWRCPPDQAQRYFTALRRAGVEAELLLFPGENHELSRSGTPWHRRERFEAMLDWWSRHLPVE